MSCQYRLRHVKSGEGVLNTHMNPFPSIKSTIIAPPSLRTALRNVPSNPGRALGSNMRTVYTSTGRAGMRGMYISSCSLLTKAFGS